MARGCANDQQTRVFVGRRSRPIPSAMDIDAFADVAPRRRMAKNSQVRISHVLRAPTTTISPLLVDLELLPLQDFEWVG